MKKRDRNRVIYWSDVATFVEWILYAFAMLFLLGGIFTGSESDKLAEGIGAMGLILFIGLLRIRMLVRAMRCDALLREAEEEDRRSPTPAPTKPAPRPTDCPNCHISIPIPADYAHNNAKCPHCAHVFRVAP